jgi:N utilization substance protein A
VEFIKNLMAPAKVRSIRILQKENGEKIATVETDPKNKRIAIGRGGQKHREGQTSGQKTA